MIYFLIGQIFVLNRLQSSPFLIGPFYQGLFWSREDRISFLVDRPYFCKISREPACTNGRERQRLNESHRRLKRAPEGGRDKWTFRGPSDCFDRLLFFILFKKSSRSLFRYPILGGLVRSRQILPRRYTLVHVSARRFPTYFAKIGPID